MTQAPTPSISRKPAAVIAIERTGDRCRFLLANAAQGSGGGVRVAESGILAASDEKALEALRNRAGSAATLVQVVPPDAALLRAAPPKLVLDGTPDQIGSALSLVAEAELPSTVQPHRRAAGVFRAGHAHTVYAVGWIGPEGSILPDARPVPAAAALAGLHRLTGAPHGIALHADRTSGTALLVAAGHGESPRLLMRVLRDDPSDDVSFDAVIAEAIQDARAELDLPEPAAIGRSLRIPAAIPSGTGLTSDKLAEYALCLGAAAFALDTKPDEQPLLAMTDRSPAAGRTLMVRLRDALGTPRAASVAAAVCALLMLGGWVLAAPIKHAVLKSRVGDDTGDYAKAVQQHDWYKALREKRWPMTALIAELVSGAPAGIRVETLAVEQDRKTVNLTGTADSAAAVEKWAASLRGKIFTGVTPSIPDESASVVRFTLKADVADAMLAAVSEIRPIASTESSRTRGDSPATDRSSRNGSSGRSGTPTPAGTRSNNNGTARTPSSTPAATVAEPPPPMSDAQIDKLASGPATIEWAKRKGQLTRTDLDDPTRKRLEHELSRIEARRKALGGGQ